MNISAYLSLYFGARGKYVGDSERPIFCARTENTN